MTSDVRQAVSHTHVSQFVGKLMSDEVRPGQAVQLSSVQRHVLRSWLAKNQIAFAPEILGQKIFTIEDLLADRGGQAGSGTAIVETRKLASPRVPAGALAEGVGVGLDVEEIGNMPETDDYRGHQFYIDNFTAKELAYAIQSSDPRQTLCGLWAAKEAIIKAEVVTGSAQGLRDIEISHTSRGKPVFSGASLSISHTKSVCVAICMRTPELSRRVDDEARVIAAPRAARQLAIVEASGSAYGRTVMLMSVTVVSLMAALWAAARFM